MRTLYICRHAKSSWADTGQADFDRPLNERGERNAAFMSRHFAERGEAVDLIISSTAVRALTTARVFADALGAKEVPAFDPSATRPQLVLESRLYHPSIPTILSLLNALPTEVHHVMIFGHNPGFTEAVAYFSSEDIGNMPTCGIARIDFPCDDWTMVSRDMGRLAWLDYPKRHPEQR